MMRQFSKIIFLCFVLGINSNPDLICQDSSNARWLRYPAISPDGKSIAFNYKGNIYLVGIEGGKAVPLTLSESYEFKAVWSRDGKSLAFASDRFGNFDVFIMPASGGEARRLTYHSNAEIPSDFTVDHQNIIFSAVRQDHSDHVQFPTGLMTELYQVPVEGGRVSQLLTTPAFRANFNADGSKLIYHDIKGYENQWRKHHISSVTRDVWLYDIASSKYQKLSNFEGEDRNPVFSSEGDIYYYLSEENGSFNVFQSSLSNPSQSTALTTFEDHPVRFLTSSSENVLCFSYHGDLYTLVPGNSPEKIEVEIPYDGLSTLPKIVPVNKDITEVSLSPNDKEFAYIFRGEIFVSSLEAGTTKRITDTPWQERSVSFSPDGRSLLYAREVQNSWDLYQTSLTRDDENYFYKSTVLKEEELWSTPKEEFQPSYSPDGQEVAFLEDRVTLKVLNLQTRAVREILPGAHNYSYSDGDQWYQWSPDGSWFLVQFGHKERIFFTEVGLIASSGTGQLRNITESGYDDVMPKWSQDGSMMIWGSDREGLRGENGWSRNGDVYALFFTKNAYDRFHLTQEEYQLIKEEEEKKEEGEGEKKEGEKDKPQVIPPITIDFDRLTERKKRLTAHTSEATDWILSDDGESLYYLTKFEGKYDIWKTELRTKKTERLAKINAEEAEMQLSKDGKFLLVLADGKPKTVEIEGGKIKDIEIKGEMVLKRDLEREYIFDHSWRQLREKFYVVDLQGVDWDFYYQQYRPFLPHINNNYDFAEMLSEMLGELNASHTGSGYRHNPENADATASLGVLIDYGHAGNGIMIAEVLSGGPMDNAKNKAKSGHIIESIDGTALTPDLDHYKLLNRKEKKPVLLSLHDPSSGQRWQEQVIPISLNQEQQLLYQRWVKSRREQTEQLSHGEVGYVHVRGMNDASMRTVIEDALGKHVSAKALVVDTRFNGGGNLHDVLSDFLNGKSYLDIIPHGQYVGSQPMNRWNKPSIVIMGESNYSDAHLFPMAYKIKEVGNTLGMPVPGTGTFVWWETQIDPTLYFGIPMGGWRAPDGKFLENNQMEPDIRVENEPGEMVAGRDQQLEAAVEELLND